MLPKTFTTCDHFVPCRAHAVSGHTVPVLNNETLALTRHLFNVGFRKSVRQKESKHFNSIVFFQNATHVSSDFLFSFRNPPPKKKKRKKKSNVAKVEKATQSHMTIHLNNCVGLNTMSYSSSEKSATRLAATSPSLKKIVSYSTQCSASLSAGLNLSLLVY